MTYNQCVNYIIEIIKRSKYKFINIEKVPEFLKIMLKENFNTEISIKVKQELIDHKSLDFFREGTYNHDSKFYYCTGNWLALKGVYDNPIEAKFKMKWESWQVDNEIDWGEE